jgi:hypothetical protein
LPGRAFELKHGGWERELNAKIQPCGYRVLVQCWSESVTTGDGAGRDMNALGVFVEKTTSSWSEHGITIAKRLLFSCKIETLPRVKNPVSIKLSGSYFSLESWTSSNSTYCHVGALGELEFTLLVYATDSRELFDLEMASSWLDDTKYLVFISPYPTRCYQTSSD